MLGGVVPGGRLLVQGHRSGVARCGPGREQQQKAGVGASVDGVALVGSEFYEQAAAATDALAGGGGDLDFAVEHGDPGSFVDLMIVKALAGRNHYRDRACIVGGGENLGGVWSQG